MTGKDLHETLEAIARSHSESFTGADFLTVLDRLTAIEKELQAGIYEGQAMNVELVYQPPEFNGIATYSGILKIDGERIADVLTTSSGWAVIRFDINDRYNFIDGIYDGYTLMELARELEKLPELSGVNVRVIFPREVLTAL